MVEWKKINTKGDMGPEKSEKLRQGTKRVCLQGISEFRKIQGL